MSLCRVSPKVSMWYPYSQSGNLPMVITRRCHAVTSTQQVWDRTPIRKARSSCTSLEKPLVHRSAKLSRVLTSTSFTVLIVHWEMGSRRKWWAMSMCFMREWNSGLCEIEIPAWSSVKMVEVDGKVKSSSWNKVRCHKTCLAIWVAAMYPASAVESATVIYFYYISGRALDPESNRDRSRKRPYCRFH
jgi:hypothetical protein